MVIGVMNYRYINQGDTDLLTTQDRYYGPFFELPLLILTNNIPAPGMLYARHLAVFVTFFAGLVGFYYLGRRLFKSEFWALLGVLMLAISPRIFADAFYNTKDIPFLVIFLLGAESLIFWMDCFEKDEKHRLFLKIAVLHSFLSAAVVTTRIPGLILVGLTTGFILLYMAIKPVYLKRLTEVLVSYLLITFSLITAFMPVLWHDPLSEFINAIHQTSRFNVWEVIVLFAGQSFSANNLMWNYLPVWIGITTPYLVLLGFFSGIIVLLKTASKEVWVLSHRTDKNWRYIFTPDVLAWLVVIGWLIVPVAALYILRSVLYDAWRQMFFIYPAMILVGVLGLRKVFEWLISLSKRSTWMKVSLSVFLLVGILEPLEFMVRNHPFENVYFNALAGDPRTLRQRFELDYWGLSYKQGIDHILANDSRNHIKLSAVGPASLYVEYMLPRDQAERITFTDVEGADYFLTNYRWHPEDFPFPDKFYSIMVNDMEIMTVYRLRPAEMVGGD